MHQQTMSQPLYNLAPKKISVHLSTPQFNPAAWNQSVSGQIDKLALADAWKTWTDNYRSLSRTGFAPMEHPATQAIQEVIDQHRRIEFTLLGAAAFCGLVAGVLWLSGGTRPNSI